MYKNLLSIITVLICIFLFSSCNTDVQTNINEIPSVIELISENGEILDDTLYASRIADSMEWFKTDTIVISNPKVVVSLVLQKPQYINITYGDFEDQLYLTPNSTVKLTLDENLKAASFNGDLVQENSYLQAIKRNDALREVGWSTTEENNADTMIAKLDRYFEVKEGILNEFVPDTDNPFYKLRIVEQQAMYTYALLNFYENQYEYSDLAMYDSLSQEVLLEEYITFEGYEQKFESGYYRFFLKKYVLEHYLKQSYGLSWRDSIQVIGYPNMTLEVAHTYYPESLEKWFNYERLFYLVQSNDNANTEKLISTQKLMHEYGQYLSETKYEELQDLFNVNVKRFSKISPGELVPSFELEDENGDPYILKTNGKPVLYDIWASWCSPCFASFPKVIELEKKYEGQLEVISLSFDENAEVHNRTLASNEIPGNVHIIDKQAFKGEFAKHFQLYGIPAYLLVDTDNRIVAFGSLNVVMDKIEDVL